MNSPKVKPASYISDNLSIIDLTFVIIASIGDLKEKKSEIILRASAGLMTNSFAF